MITAQVSAFSESTADGERTRPCPSSSAMRPDYGTLRSPAMASPR